MSLKLDISKSYDRVEWHFIEQVMIKMGFEQEWIRRVMMYIGSVSFAIFINGEPSSHFRPSRGLHQGDPLSLYMFLLCIEGLTTLLSKAVESHQIIGLKICRRALSISHLLFTYNSVLFYKVNIVENMHIMTILEKYERALGAMY